ncbi:MAG: mannosyltransferase family protein [Candidatus Berkelbacteria bacterium]
MKKNIFLLIFWFLLINLFALLVLNRFNLKPDDAYPWINQSTTVQQQSWDPISLHARWDSVYYLDIAQHGYSVSQTSSLSNVVFFPLYPILIKLIAVFTSSDFILAGWIVSILSLIGAVFYLYKLIKEFHPEVHPESAIFFLLIFPTAFFYNAVYTEALFLLVSIVTFYYAKKGNFALAGVIGLLASLTRITGVLLFIPILWEFIAKNGAKKLFSWSVIPILLIPLGTIAFFAYHYLAFGDFLLFLKVEGAWGRSFGVNLTHLSMLSNPATVNLVLDLMFTVFAVICTIFVFSRRWISYGLYMVATLAVALSTGTMMSIGRYVLVLFPIFILIASVKNKNFEKGYILSSVLLLAMNIILFVNWYWAG